LTKTKDSATLKAAIETRFLGLGIGVAPDIGSKVATLPRRSPSRSSPRPQTQYCSLKDAARKSIKTLIRWLRFRLSWYIA